MSNKIKDFFSTLVFPKGWELVFLVAAVGAYMFGSTFTLNGDASYGYDMIERRADPQAFADNDLAVIGSMQGTFLLYQLLYYVPGFAKNFPLGDLIISFPISILLLLAWYNIFHELTKNRWITSVALFLLLFVGSRFAIGGSTIPLFYLSPISSVLFAQTFALFFYLKKWPVASLATVSLTTYLHPPSGFVFLCLYGVLILYDAWQNKKYRHFWQATFLASLIVVPNLVMMRNQIGLATDAEKYFRIFHSLTGYGYGHIYIGSYPEAYVFTLSAWLLLLLANYKKQVHIEYRQTLLRLIAVAFLLVGMWLVDVYYVHNLPVFFLYVATRVTYVLKPLFILLFTVLAWDLSQKKTLTSIVAAICLMVSLIVPSFAVGLSLLWIVGIYFLGNVEARYGKQGWNMSLWSGTGVRLIKKWRLPVVLPLVFVIAVIGIFEHRFNNKLHKVYRLLQGENVFNFSYDEKKNFGLNRSHPEYGGVIEWAKQYKGKMFIIPPDDCKYSGAFRFITKNSIYVSMCDTFQLSFIPEYYYASYDRLVELNFKVVSWGVFDYSGYNMLELSDLRKKQADFVIFDKTSIGYRERAELPVYQNAQYIIYSLK